MPVDVDEPGPFSGTCHRVTESDGDCAASAEHEQTLLRCEQARRSGGKLDECIRLFAEVLRERSLTVGKPQPCRQIAGIDDVRA